MGWMYYVCLNIWDSSSGYGYPTSKYGNFQPSFYQHWGIILAIFTIISCSQWQSKVYISFSSLVHEHRELIHVHNHILIHNDVCSSAFTIWPAAAVFADVNYLNCSYLTNDLYRKCEAGRYTCTTCSCQLMCWGWGQICNKK